MIARITRALLALQLLLALGAAALAAMLRHAEPLIAILFGCACVLLLRLLIIVNNFSVAWRYRSQTPRQYRLNWRQSCMLFFGEFGASMIASSWNMPFLAFSERTVAPAAALPVLLIHGYGCNSGYWHAISKPLLEARISHYAIDLEPVAGGIDDYVPLIHAAVERICRKSGQGRIIIVAHSMGGLAARAYLRKFGGNRIAKIITIGTPHHGTALARFGIGLNTAQMRWIANDQEGLASEWLRNLAAQEDEASCHLFVSLYSHHDNIVSPQTSACLAGAKNIEFSGIGHVALGFHAAVQAQVIREILDTGAPAV